MKLGLFIVLLLIVFFSCQKDNKPAITYQASALLEQNKSIILKIIDGLNQKSWDRLLCFAKSPADSKNFKKVHSLLRKAFPDYHFKTGLIFTRGDTVVTIGTLTVSHTREFDVVPIRDLAPS